MGDQVVGADRRHRFKIFKPERFCSRKLLHMITHDKYWIVRRRRRMLVMMPVTVKADPFNQPLADYNQWPGHLRLKKSLMARKLLGWPHFAGSSQCSKMPTASKEPFDAGAGLSTSYYFKLVHSIYCHAIKLFSYLKNQTWNLSFKMDRNSAMSSNYIRRRSEAKKLKRQHDKLSRMRR